MIKICKKCCEEKPIECFSKDKSKNDGLMNQCKECIKKYKNENKEYLKKKSKEYIEKNKQLIKDKNKKYRSKNKNKLKDAKKNYYENNKDVYKEKNKKYKEENKEKILQYYKNNKEYYSKKGKNRRELYKDEISENFKKYYQEHKEYFKKYKEKYRKSEKAKKTKSKWCNEYNSKHKHVVLWRSLLRRTIVQLKIEKTANTETMLGYSSLELKEHIEKNWLEGMSWSNYGDWHVDHIRSVGTFNSEYLPSEVNALSNLRPMWATTRIINGIFI